jgi:hypothetical protein
MFAIGHSFDATKASRQGAIARGKRFAASSLLSQAHTSMQLPNTDKCAALRPEFTFGKTVPRASGILILQLLNPETNP